MEWAISSKACCSKSYNTGNCKSTANPVDACQQSSCPKAIKPMRWTKELPTKTGFYWIRGKYETTSIMIYKEDSPIDSDYKNCEWCKILEPEE